MRGGGGGVNDHLMRFFPFHIESKNYTILKKYEENGYIRELDLLIITTNFAFHILLVVGDNNVQKEYHQFF